MSSARCLCVTALFGVFACDNFTRLRISDTNNTKGVLWSRYIICSMFFSLSDLIFS